MNMRLCQHGSPTAASILILITVSSVDYLSHGYSFIVLYVIAVAYTATCVGGKYSYVYCIIASVIRTAIEVKNEPIGAGVWLFFNVVTANLLVNWLVVWKEKLLNKLRESSLTDPLTGLPNRRAFHEYLELAIAHSQRYHEKISIAYLDVDGFKAVNDRYGHHKGDELLVMISKTLKKDLRADDLPARLGGDEFAIVYAHENGEDGMIKRLKSDLDEEVKGKFNVSFSIGVINYYGDHPACCDVLCRAADELMYEVKKTSKNDIRMRDYNL